MMSELQICIQYEKSSLSHFLSWSWQASWEREAVEQMPDRQCRKIFILIIVVIEWMAHWAIWLFKVNLKDFAMLCFFGLFSWTYKVYSVQWLTQFKPVYIWISNPVLMSYRLTLIMIARHSSPDRESSHPFYEKELESSEFSTLQWGLNY